jgi:hypothetical protein
MEDRGFTSRLEIRAVPASLEDLAIGNDPPVNSARKTTQEVYLLEFNCLRAGAARCM